MAIDNDVSTLTGPLHITARLWNAGEVHLSDIAGHLASIPVESLARREDLLARLDPEDAQLAGIELDAWRRKLQVRAEAASRTAPPFAPALIALRQ